MIVDKIGYGKLVALALVGHIVSAFVTFGASSPQNAYDFLYWGMFIFAFANGTLEAVANPLVATIFPKQRTHYLNILHASWPLGMVVGAIAWAPQVLVAKKDLPVKNFQEFLAYAKKPGATLSYGSSGVGTVPQLIVAQMLKQTGVKAEHVPYRGGAPAITDLRGGVIDFMSDTVPVVRGMIAEGTIKALGVSTAERIPSLPDVPTLQEQGVKDFNLQGYILLVVPAKTPDQIDGLLEEIVDRFGKLPPQAQTLIDVHRLRVLSQPYGVVKVDAAPGVINITFKPQPPIDPMRIIELIQKNKHIKLAGNEKLRIERELKDPKDRAQMVRDILRNLGQPVVAA